MGSPRDHLDSFGPRCAETLAAALIAYVPTMGIAIDYAKNGNVSNKTAMDGMARFYGLELITFVRLHALFAQSWTGREDDPSPAMPLAAALGESLAILALVDDPSTVAAVPVATVEMVDALYDDAARAWMSRFLPELPELTARS